MAPRGIALMVGAAVVAAAAMLAWSDDAGVPAAPPDPIATAVAAGQSYTLTTADGPIHVWIPSGYHADGAAIVVYVHGYYTDVDKAWIDNRLPEQFALASVNAVFIAAAAPAGGRQAVRWPALEDLLAAVFGAIDVARPTGEVIAIGHSGAYRTLLEWTAYPGLDWMVHLDATYGENEAWLAWLAASDRHHLLFIGDDTARWCEELAMEIEARWPGQLTTIDRFGDDDPLPDGPAPTRAVYLRSQWGHSPLAADGRAIPLVLRMTPVELLATGLWQRPLGLPPRDAGVDGRRR